MNEDMKYDYNVCSQRLNEEIDTMIDEIHSAYMNEIANPPAMLGRIE